MAAGLHLEKGDGEFLGAAVEACLQHTRAQAVVPHQPPPTVLAQVEVLEHLHQREVRVSIGSWACTG